MQWYFYIGLIAAICIAIFTMPQLIQVIKTKHTEGLSIMMLGLLTLGNLCFALNGIGVLTNENLEIGDKLSGGLPLLLANAIAFSISTTLLVIKFTHQRQAKKFNVTEKEFCDNYETYKAKRKMQKFEQKAKDEATVTSVSEPTSAPTSEPTNPTIGA